MISIIRSLEREYKIKNGGTTGYIFPPTDNNRDMSDEATNLISKTLQQMKNNNKIQQKSPNNLMSFLANIPISHIYGLS